MEFLDKEIKDLLCNAAKLELEASYMYKGLANEMQKLGYFGFQKYFLNESDDELKHYQNHVDYINDRNDIVELQSINQYVIPNTIKSLLNALEFALSKEVELNNLYNDFSLKCFEHKDMSTFDHIIEYVRIQRKSVGEFLDIISTVKELGDEKTGLLLLDQKIV